MTVLLAVLISGVLLDLSDKPKPNYQLVFTATDGKLFKVITDENGKFQVDLKPGTYRYEFGSFTVDKKTSTLKLRDRVIEVIKGTERAAEPPIIEIFKGTERADPIPLEPHTIEVIKGNQRFDLNPGPRG